jgi:hypothetical protein
MAVFPGALPAVLSLDARRTVMAATMVAPHGPWSTAVDPEDRDGSWLGARAA